MDGAISSFLVFFKGVCTLTMVHQDTVNSYFSCKLRCAEQNEMKETLLKQAVQATLLW